MNAINTAKPLVVGVIGLLVGSMCGCFAGIGIGLPSRPVRETMTALAANPDVALAAILPAQQVEVTVEVTVIVERMITATHTPTPRFTPTETITPTATTTPTVTFTPTITPTPSQTLVPSSTPTTSPSPTLTPEPTRTSPPVAATCSEVRKARQTLTDVQWDSYLDTQEGLWVVDWDGRIEEVGDYSILAGGYPVTIDVGNDCDLYFTLADESEAILLSKNQKVIVTGQVDFVSEFFGLYTYHMEEGTLEIRNP